MRCAIVDIDGTLANVQAIRHFVIPTPPSRRKDFSAFHQASVDCPTNDWVVRAVKDCAAQGLAILIVTARGAAFRNQTAFWLAMHDIPSDMLFMRPVGDQRPDFEVKTDILSRIRDLGFAPVIAFDDNPNVIALWEANHIPVVRVPGYSE